MKSRDGCTQMDLPFSCGPGRKGYIRRHRQLLLGMMLCLILFWTISAICLIITRRSERSLEEKQERKATVALLFPDAILDKPWKR